MVVNQETPVILRPAVINTSYRVLNSLNVLVAESCLRRRSEIFYIGKAIKRPSLYLSGGKLRHEGNIRIVQTAQKKA